MKKGKSLNELALELERQSKSKKDYVADTWALKMVPTEGGALLEWSGTDPMPLKPIAHMQLGNTLGIPKTYYDRMLQNDPELLAYNVNRWFYSNPSKHLVRTLDNNVRAILSDKYRPLDNLDLAEAILPKLGQLDVEVLDGEITEQRFYLKAATAKITGDVAKGDIVQAGLVVSNSEVGMGSLRLEALDYRLVCLNGMISEQAVRKAHLGRRKGGDDLIEDAREFFRDETRALEDAAFFSKVRDSAEAMFDQKRFDVRLNKYREAVDRTIPDEPAKVVEVTAKRFGLGEAERGSVLNYLIKGGDLSQWGLANAITRAAQDVESYDRSVEMEKLGGNVVELGTSSWKELVTI